MTDLLDKDDSWDWNAEFDGAVKQLRDDWQPPPPAGIGCTTTRQFECRVNARN